MPESASAAEWVAVAAVDDLWEGEMIDVQVGDEDKGNARNYSSHDEEGNQSHRTR